MIMLNRSWRRKLRNVLWRKQQVIWCSSWWTTLIPNFRVLNSSPSSKTSMMATWPSSTNSFSIRKVRVWRSLLSKQTSKALGRQQLNNRKRNQSNNCPTMIRYGNLIWTIMKKYEQMIKPSRSCLRNNTRKFFKTWKTVGTWMTWCLKHGKGYLLFLLF